MIDSTDYLRSYLQQHYKPQDLQQILESREGEVAPELGRLDFSFFCKYYLPHYFPLPYSPMHHYLQEIINSIPHGGGIKAAVASPRSSAKSTLTVTGQILWHICYNHKRYILLIKDTHDQAGLDLTGIAEEIETNPRIQRDFGNLKGDSWSSHQLLTKNDILIQAVGSGMKIRGRRHKEARPDLVILDDIENDENTNTPEQRLKLMNWFLRAVMKVGTKETDYLLIGTILHYDSLLTQVLANPGWDSRKYAAVVSWAANMRLWDRWGDIYVNIDDPLRKKNALKFYKEHEKKMLAKSRVLWPEGLDYYFLMTKLIDEGKPSFDSEFQNDPISLEDALFHHFHYYTTQERPVGARGHEAEYKLFLCPTELGLSVCLEDCRLFGACDPSLGKTKTSDYSAILIGALSPANRLFLLEADIERRHPNKIISDIFKHAFKYQGLGLSFEKFAVESVAFQEFFKDQLAEKSMEAELYLPITETKNASRNKELRIESLEPDITNGYIMFLKSHRLLLDQLRYFPKADHDDGPDALEMLRDVSRVGGMVVDSIDLRKL